MGANTQKLVTGWWPSNFKQVPREGLMLMSQTRCYGISFWRTKGLCLYIINSHLFNDQWSSLHKGLSCFKTDPSCSYPLLLWTVAAHSKGLICVLILKYCVGGLQNRCHKNGLCPHRVLSQTRCYGNSFWSSKSHIHRSSLVSGSSIAKDRCVLMLKNCVGGL